MSTGIALLTLAAKTGDEKRTGHRRAWALLFAGMCLTACVGVTKADDSFKIPIGVAKIDVTPSFPVVLAGYGSRNKPHEGIDTKLYARAMVIGDRNPVAVVVLDNCGVPKAVADAVKARVRQQGLAGSHVVVAATHTHNAPNLVGYAPILWKGRTTPAMDQAMQKYTAWVVDKMAAAIEQAMKRREPREVFWGQGRVEFGGNRRVIRENSWSGFGFQRDAPVDHSLPVLVARDEKGKVLAVWSNYACHCTTVGARNRIGGDWAGFANDAIEAHFPDSVSLVSIGCGADIGPQPSGSLELAQRHGKSLADEVKRLVESTVESNNRPNANLKISPRNETEFRWTKLLHSPRVESVLIDLPLAHPGTIEMWRKQSEGRGWQSQLARHLLEQQSISGSLPDKVAYRITTWKFGEQLAMVFMPGEVVVDYAVHLKSRLDWQRLWITAWANDMPGYIPSRRVLMEGGYEAEFSQVYYGWPSPYEPVIEDRILNAVTELAGQSFKAKPDQNVSPFHQIPSREPLAFERLAEFAAAPKPKPQQAIFDRLKSVLDAAQPGVQRIESDQGQRTDWLNFAGEMTPRVFVRQDKVGAEMSWTTPIRKMDPSQKKNLDERKNADVVYCFAGGLGYRSQKETDGFEMVINGENRIRFDLTLELTRWKSDQGTSELIYLPTWKSSEDSGGFFFLKVSSPGLESSTRITVRSLGSDSLRWFGLDVKQKTAEHLSKIRKATQDRPKLDL